jgi:hypothetical protein
LYPPEFYRAESKVEGQADRWQPQPGELLIANHKDMWLLKSTRDTGPTAKPSARAQYRTRRSRGARYYHCGDHLFPGPQYTAKENQFPDVVGVVVRQLEGFAQEGLAISVRQGCEKI